MEYLAPGITAAIVVLIIEYIIRFYLYKKRIFQEAIRIQVALNQMLGISLQMRRFYDEQMSSFLQVYSNSGLDEPESTWQGFRHIDLGVWKNTFDVICFDWDVSQFLTTRENKVRHVLTHLIPIKLGFQSLMQVVEERNNLLEELHPRINAIVEQRTEIFIYQGANLESVIGHSSNVRLRDITNHYIRTLNAVIADCDKTFNIMTSYIDQNFCCYQALVLRIPPELQQVLSRVLEEERQESR